MIIQGDFTPEMLITLAGAVLSLIFAYFPIVEGWFNKIPSEWKPLVNAGILLLVALGVVGAGCLGIVDYFACSTAGLLQAVWLWLFALVGNNLTYVYLVRQRKQK